MLRNEVKKALVEAINVECEKRGYEERFMHRDVEKNNGVIVTALMPMNVKDKVIPTIYADDMIDKIMEFETNVQKCANDFLVAYIGAKGQIPVDNVPMLHSREYVLDHAVFQLVNRNSNKEMLEKVPHIDFLDLAAIVRVMIICEDNDVASYVVKNEMLRMIEIDENEILEAARNNTERIMEFECKAMKDIITEIMGFDMMDDEEIDYEEFPMNVLSSKWRINGATVMMYPEYLKKVADKYNKSLVILPSSINEVIAVPIDELTDSEREYFTTMVNEVNETEVADTEILSETIYLYDLETGKVGIA